MPKENFYLLAPPGAAPSPRGWDGIPVHLAYQLGPGLTLSRLPGADKLRGGVMAVTDCSADPLGDPRAFCRQVEAECQARGFRGVLLDLDRRLPPLEGLVSALAPLLERRGITLFVPEYFSPLAPHGKVLLSSALSGGSLTRRLEEGLDRFGPDRLVLAVEKAAEDFTLPAPTGCGVPLTPEQLRGLQQQLRPSVFFSPELCARYFTYRDKSGGVHFVLFDDEDTLERKLHTARAAGAGNFLLPWAEVSRSPERFGLRQTRPQNRRQ